MNEIRAPRVDAPLLPASRVANLRLPSTKESTPSILERFEEKLRAALAQAQTDVASNRYFDSNFYE